MDERRVLGVPGWRAVGGGFCYGRRMWDRIGGVAAVVMGLCLVAEPAMARDWYVSAARGKGKKGTKEKPAKDLGNIASKLEAGDVVYIAEGTYVGRGKSGSTTIKVPVRIIGGWSDDFSSRAPWGEHATILSGVNPSKNYTAEPTLFIDLMKYTGESAPVVVDGLVIDLGGRNHYKSEEEAKLIPKAAPKNDKLPSPSMGGLVVRVQKSGKFDKGERWQVRVINNIVINSYGNQAALNVSAYKGSRVWVQNNLVAQHSGYGIYLGSKYAGAESPPMFDVTANTVLFSWNSGFGVGSSVGMDANTKVFLRHDALGFADFYSIWNGKGAKDLSLISNLVTGAHKGDYLERDTVMAVADIEDEAELLADDSEDNTSAMIGVPVSQAFAKLYGSRVIVDRAKLEADISATNSGANALRAMLGLPTQAGSVAWPKIEVFLNRLSVEDALKVAQKPFGGKWGCGAQLIEQASESAVP